MSSGESFWEKTKKSAKEAADATKRAAQKVMLQSEIRSRNGDIKSSKQKFGEEVYVAFLSHDESEKQRLYQECKQTILGLQHQIEEREQKIKTLDAASGSSSSSSSSSSTPASISSHPTPPVSSQPASSASSAASPASAASSASSASSIPVAQTYVKPPAPSRKTKAEDPIEPGAPTGNMTLQDAKQAHQFYKNNQKEVHQAAAFAAAHEEEVRAAAKYAQENPEQAKKALSFAKTAASAMPKK